jgi:hypothetical protein
MAQQPMPTRRDSFQHVNSAITKKYFAKRNLHMADDDFPEDIFASFGAAGTRPRSSIS